MSFLPEAPPFWSYHFLTTPQRISSYHELIERRKRMLQLEINGIKRRPNNMQASDVDIVQRALQSGLPPGYITRVGRIGISTYQKIIDLMRLRDPSTKSLVTSPRRNN